MEEKEFTLVFCFLQFILFYNNNIFNLLSDSSISYQIFKKNLGYLMSRSSKKEQIKAFMNKMPSWKKKLWLSFVIGGPILMAGLMIWMFTAHGFTGHFVWFPPITYIILILIGCAIAMPILSIIDVKKAAKKENRKHIPSRIIWGLSIFVVIIPLGFIGLVAINALHPAGDKAPQLLITSQTGTNGIPDMAVVYWSDLPTQDSIKWGQGALTETLTDTGPTTQHTFVLLNLQPNTRYSYQINGAGTIYNFSTPTGSNDWYRFAVTSDPHYGREASKPGISAEIMAQIAKPANNLSSFYMLGDFVEYGFIDAQWKEALDATSPYTTQIPFRPLIGNHDTLIAGATPYYLDYCYPEKMPIGTDKGSQLYHQIDVNNIHIFMLDLEWGIEQYPGAQQAWFEAQIAKVPKSDWTIVMSHCFFYSSGITSLGMPWYDHPQLIPAFEQIFIDNDVDMVFSGHNHHAEVLQKSGITYFIAGAMGGHPDPSKEHDSVADSKWYQQIGNDNQFGYFEVDITGNNATITFLNRLNTAQYNITINK